MLLANHCVVASKTHLFDHLKSKIGTAPNAGKDAEKPDLPYEKCDSHAGEVWQFLL